MIDDPFAVALAPVRGRRQFRALLRRADPEFVRCSFLTVFGREPTASELSRSLERLSGGASRAAFLRELLAAGAGAGQHDSGRWLHDALRHESIRRPRWYRAMASNAKAFFHRFWGTVSPDLQPVDVREAVGVLDYVPTVAGAAARAAERVYEDLSAALAHRKV